jgi:hypothetical protein
MDEAKVQRDKEQWRQKQAEERLVILEQRRARGMEAVAAKKEAMGGQMDSEGSIARQTKDRMKELLDMELVGIIPWLKPSRGKVDNLV